MADIFKKFRGKQNSETPSGNNADPIKVAIDASSMGPTAALTFERLIAQSFAYMFVGGENVSKVDDLKGLDKKNKLTDILDGLNKINENFEKVLTRMDKSQGVLDIITKLILGGNPTGIPVTLVTRGVNRIQNTPEGGKGGGDKSSNKLDIVLKGKNTDKVLHELSELAKDEKQLKSLAESFALLAAASEKWKPIDKYLEDLTKGIKAFSELGNVNFSSLKAFNSYLKDINELEFDTKKFNSTNKSVIKFINQLVKIKSDEAIVNAQNIEKVFKSILKINFDKLNVNDETVEQIKNMITVSKRLNTFGKMKFKDIEPNADILIKIFNKLSKLKPIENFDSSIIESIDTLNSVVKYIGESEFNKIEDYEIDPKIDLLNVIFRKIDNLVPPKPIENGVFETINGLQDTSISLHVMTTIDISEVPNHVQTLSEVFKSIDKIKYPKPLPEDVIKTLTALNNVFKFLENKISSKELPDIKPKVEQLNFLFEEIKKIKEPKPFSENFTKSLSTLDELFRYIVEMRFNYQSEDLQDNISHIVSCVYRVNWLLETIENSKFKDSKKLKYISDVTTVVTDLDKMANTIDDFVIPSDKKIEKIIEFIQKLGDESDDSLISKILELKLDSRIKEIEKNVDALKNTVTSLATVAGCCALFIILGPLALAGIPLLKLAINGLMDIIGKLGDKKIQADIKLSFGNVENLGKLVAISALVLILAGFIVLNCPEIVVAAFGFAFVLGMFIGMVVGVLSIFGKGAKEAFENAHKIGALIAVASLCLIIGGAIVLFAPQIVIAAFAFTVVLSLFLMATIAAIGVGAKALKAGIMKDANKIALLISVCTLCLVIGGAVVLFAPQIVVAAFAFTVVLSLFLFAVIGAISLASKPLKAGAMQDAHKMAILIGICSLCLIIGGGVITMFPQIVAGVFIFTLALSTLIFGTLTPINLNSKGIARAEKSMPKLMMVMALSTAILLGAGAICAAHPEILVYGTIFSAALAIVVGGIAYVCKIIGKNQKDIFKGALVMGTIVAIVGLASVALLLTKNAIEGLDIGKFVISMGAVSLLILAWGGLSVSLGALSMIPFFWAGVGALAAIVGIINLAGLALLTTAKAMEIFSNVKPLNFGTITKNILGMISVAALMVPLGYVAPFIIVASGAVSLLAVVIGQISKVIADVASLKIPEYEGTKIVRYRKLQTSDFKDAAENVKLIVTTLGQALIDVYNQNPKIFSSGSKLGDLFGSDTIFSRVCKSVANMDMVISNIANAVKNYAALKIPIYSGTKVTGYHFLGKSDFEAASTNVKTVIKTLGQALIDLYNENSEMFQDKSIFKNDPDNTPLGMTINVTRKLGKVISSIADGVKDYANLRFPIDWNKDGKAIKWSTMKDSDVINAGNTVKNVVVTFAKALIELYNEKPEMFQDKSWFSNSASNTPLGMTINITRKLGKVIGSIADGVRDYANLRFPIDWNKDGKAIKWSKMSDSDILSAGNTVKTVVVTFAKALIDLYNEKPEMFQDKSIFSNSASNTPLGMVIAVTSKLGKVISSIADGVKEYGNLRYAVEWNKDGKPVKFQKMTDKEIADAGANVQTIVVTMAQALMKVYDDHNEWFKDGGNFLKKTDSPFTKVLKASERMGSLVGTIGTSVGKIAKLQVPIEWNKDGRPIKYETLSQKHFTMAAEGIDKIITTLGGALMNTFKNNAEMFEDGEDSLFAQGINSVATMGTMIGNIAKGIQGYSKLQIIEEYDKDGKPLKIRPMKDTDFANAATNIEKIVSTLGESILTLITKKPEFFEDGADSAFGMACAAIASMGEGIGNIATGLVSYAELKIPVAFDKDGKPTDYKKLTEPDFELAGKNIATIVTTIGNSIMTTYTEHEDWFDTGWFGIASEAPFAIMINSIATMGEGIKNIAASIQSYSSLQIPTEFNEKGEPIKFKVLTNDDMTLAATNIETVVTTVANALITTYNKNSDLFKADGDEDTPFTKISKSCANLGIMMTGVASGIQAYASMRMPSSFDKNGKPTGFTEINDKTIIAAGTNIGTVITALGSAIVDVYKNNESLFDVPSITTESGFLFLKVKSTKPGKGDTPFQRVVNGISAAGTMLVSVAESIVSFSTMTKEIDIDSAKTNIETIITALGGAILGVVENSPKYFDFDNLTKISNSILTLSFAISNVANGIQKFAKLEMPEVDQATGRTTGNFIKMSNQDIIGATDNIKTVMTTIGKAISEVSDEVCGYWFSGSKVEKSMQAINLMSNAVSTVGDTIIKFGTAQMPIDWDKDGKPIKFTHFTNKMATEATSTIVTIMTTLATAINTATNSLPQEFVEIKPYHNYSVAESKPSSNKIEMMLNAITSAVNVVSGTAGQISMLSGESPLRLTDKNGKHIGSVKMTKTVFEKASTNIKTILTCISESLSSAVSFLYGDKDFKEFAGGNINSLYESIGGISTSTQTGKIFSTINALSAMNTVLQVLASTARSWSGTTNETYWVYEGGKLKQRTRKVEKINAETASANIKSIVTTVAESLSSAVSFLYGDKDFKDFAGGNINSLYESIGGISTSAQTGKIFSTINALAAINNVLRAMASTARAWGDGTTEIYYSFSNGRLIPHERKTEKINSEDAATNIKAVVTGIASALNDAVTTLYGEKDIKDFIGSDYRSLYLEAAGKNLESPQQTSKIFNTISALFGMSRLLFVLSGVARAWGNFTNSEIVTDSDGKITVKEGESAKIDVSKVTANITTVVTGIATALSGAVDTLYQSKDWKDIISDGFGDIFSNAKKNNKIFNTISSLFAINNLLKVLHKTVVAWSTFTSIDITSSNGNIIYKESGEQEKINVAAVGENIKTVVKSLATAVASAVNELVANKDLKEFINEDGFEINKGFNKKSNSRISNVFTALFNMNDLLKALGETARGWGSGMDVTVANVPGIGLVVSTKQREKIDVDAAATSMSTIMGTFVSMVKQITSLDDIDDISEYSTMVINSVNEVDKVLKGMTSILQTTQSLNTQYRLLGNNINIKPLIGDIKENVIALNGMNNAIAVSNGNFGSINSGISDFYSVFDISAPVRRFKHDVSSILGTIESIKNVDITSNVSKLQNGISNLNNAMGSTQAAPNFNQQTEDLSKYVKAVSGVNVKGVDSLIQLIRELNRLGVNMGNMDKLTNAITKNLSKSLSDLSKELKKLDTTMKQEAKRQTTRNEEIKRSVETVRSLMNTEMKVKVTSDSSGSNSSSGGSLDGSDSSNGSSREPKNGE